MLWQGGVIGDVVDHRGGIGLRVYRREEGEEIVNIKQHITTKHNMSKSGAGCDLTYGYTISAKGDNIQESFPGVRHFRTNESEGKGCMLAMLGTRDR